WYERNTGQAVECVQHRLRHPVLRWMGATLDGIVAGSGAVFEAKFMLPWSFSEEGAAEKHMAQLQHNMWVTNSRLAALSVITGGGKWVEIKISADPLYQHLLLTAEKKFWRCVESGEPPHLFDVEPPRPRIEAVRIIDMSTSNAWAEFAAVFRSTRDAFLEHEKAKTELKGLMPEDAKEAIGHGIRDKRSKWCDQLRCYRDGGRPCAGPVKQLAPLQRRWPRRRPSSPIRKNHWWRPSGPPSRGRATGSSAMPRSRAALRSCGRAWADMRSRRCRRLRSTRMPAWCD